MMDCSQPFQLRAARPPPYPKISQPCEEMLIDCRFGGKVYKCSQVFHPLVTDEGLCCVFNMLHFKFMYASHVPLTFQNRNYNSSEEPVDWNSEVGYPEKLPNVYYPKKVVGVGESLGLTVTLDVQKDKYYCSSSSSVGFKFALHSPNESPNIRETGFFVEHGKETKLRISPDKIETKKHLKTMKREYRQCLFHHEGNLKFFAHYTQRNCELECVAETTKNYCGCVGYFMPKIYENISVCSINDVYCQRKVLLRTDKRIKSCLDDCLPSCYGLNFEVDAFSTKLSHFGANGTKSNIKNLSYSYVEENIAIVHMYFKENSYRSKIQTEFIGVTDFLSSIGGLMGLFLGFSFISIAELIYFAIIRPYQDISQFTSSQDICTDLERRPHGISTIKSKTLNSFVIKRYNNVFATSEIHNEEKFLYQQKMLCAHMLHDDLKKPGTGVSYVWLE